MGHMLSKGAAEDPVSCIVVQPSSEVCVELHGHPVLHHFRYGSKGFLSPPHALMASSRTGSIFSTVAGVIS